MVCFWRTAGIIPPLRRSKLETVIAVLLARWLLVIVFSDAGVSVEMEREYRSQ
jgi:hypothetical protein